MRKVVVASSERKVKKYRVRWLETNVVSGTVCASSQEEAIKKARRKLPVEGIVMLSEGKPHIGTIEPVGLNESVKMIEDYLIENLSKASQADQTKTVSSSKR